MRPLPMLLNSCLLGSRPLGSCLLGYRLPKPLLSRLVLSKFLPKSLLTGFFRKCIFILAVGFSSSCIAKDLSFITIDVAPWASINTESGKMEGAFIEIVNEISKRIDRKISISITPFARVDRELETGLHDCTILVPRPDSLVVKGDVVSYHPIGIIPRKGITVDSYEDIHKLKLSVTRGATLTPEFDNDTKLHKEYDTDYLMGLRKVARGRLDAIVGAIPTLIYLAEQEGIANELGKPYPVIEVPLLFQCSKNSSNLDIIPLVNKAIADIKREGVLADIQSRYYF